jgi:hypothetical protein
MKVKAPSGVSTDSHPTLPIPMDDEKPDTLKREQFDDVEGAVLEEDEEPNEVLQMQRGDDGGLAWLVRVCSCSTLPRHRFLVLRCESRPGLILLLLVDTKVFDGSLVHY